MRRIGEFLRLWDEFGASQRQIADTCRLPRNTGFRQDSRQV
jgi:hypothetical protein